MLRNQSVSIAKRGFANVATKSEGPKKYGRNFTVTLIPGDGIGNETADSVKTIFKQVNVPVNFEQIDVSGVPKDGKSGVEQFKEGISSLKRNKVGLKGILHTPLERAGHPSFNVALRKELDIFASIALIKSIPGVETRMGGIDMALVRENTEGEYSGLEHRPNNDIVESLKIITAHNSERIGRFALDFAKLNDRKKVTVIHKANIMKQSDGLFRSTIQKLADEYPGIDVNDMIVDNASMQAVSRPQQFDVLVMPSLYGTILSNIGSGLVGGPGVVPGASIGREYAVFEPGCRHVGLDIQGRNQANPTAMLLSSVMMLRHLGLNDYADLISNATYGVLKDNKVRTADIGGTNSTTEFTRAVLDKLETL